MAYVFANDIGGFQGAREREQGRFDVLARQAAADQERAIASANEADRFAFQAAARDAQLMEDRNRFQLQQALQERDREERRGDVLFNRRLMLGQEGREQDRFKLAKERFETERKLAQDELNLDQRVAGEEGRLLMQQFDAAQRREKELAESLKQLDRQIQFQTDTAAKRGLVADRDGFFKPSGLQAMDPEAAKTAALVNRNLRELVGAAAPLSDEIKRARELKEQTRNRAARFQSYFTPEGLATATGSFYPFPASAGPVAPAPAPAAPMTAAPPAPTTNWIDAVSPSGRPYRVQR